LLDKDYYDIAASRAYYTAFYVASALLLNENIDTSKHSRVIALIHQHFVKAGKLTTEQGKNLNWLFELRNVGDYGVSVHVTSEDAYSGCGGLFGIGQTDTCIMIEAAFHTYLAENTISSSQFLT
jgi:uncharacterized protein (UPF0332 family)